MTKNRTLSDLWRIKRVCLFPWLLRRRIRDLNELKRFKGFDSARLVSFDVFDTALLRSVAQPADALALAAWRAERRLGCGIGMRELLEARTSAEIQARRVALAEGREEVTLDEIYSTLPASLSEVGPVLRAEELETERDVCCANPVILNIYLELVASSIAVAFISDTSLPETFLEELLAEKGYTGPHRVFASSAFGKSKSHGELFSVVARQLSIPPSDIWHIGDNARSDVVHAHRAGVNGLWFRPKLRRPAHRKRKQSTDGERELAKSLMEGIPESLSSQDHTAPPPWKGIGLAVAGPLYLGFTQWLIKRLAEFDAERIYFLSRDGQIIHRIYDVLRNFYPTTPAPTYLMVSRRSLAVPTLERIDQLALNMLCGANNQLWMPVEEYLTRIGLDPRVCHKAMLDHVLPPGTLIDGNERRTRLHSLFRSLETDILDVARRERILLVRYLQQEGCFEVEKLALCDIGWKGTLQKALGSILGSERPVAQVSGYYLGTEECVRRLVNCGISAGWLMDANVPEKRRRILQSGLAIVELLFTANHGSVRGYCEKQGKVTPTFENLGIESEYVKAADAIQVAALQFVDRYTKAFGGFPPLDLNRSDVFPALARLIDRPTLVEAQALGNLTHVNGLGNAHLVQPIARPPSIWQFLVKPSTVIAKFRQSPWRLGFLVRFIKSPRLASAAMMLRRSLEPRSRAA